MKNKKIFTGLASLAVISLILCGCGKKVELKDGAEVAVSAKDTKITANEYYKEIKSSNISTLVDMIDHSLFDKKYPTDDTEDKEVQQQIDNIKKYVSNDETKFNTLIKQYFGVNSEKELDEMLRLEYKRNKAVKEYISNNITDKEIEKYYNDNIYGEISTQHILIKLNVSDSATTDEKTEAEEQALKTANEIIEKLNNGEDFAKLAKTYSNDNSNNEKGGDLGYIQPDSMVTEFKDALLKLKDGEYTKTPVKTKYGYHIIYRKDTKEKKALKDVKDEIKEKLVTNKLEEDNSNYYKSLVKVREEAKISWNDDELEKKYNEYMDTLISNSSSN